MAGIYLLLLLLAIVTNVLLIVRLALRSEKSFTLAAYLVFLFLILLWSLPQFFINLLLVENIYFTPLDRIEAFGYIFLPVAFLLFSISFSEKADLLRKLSVLGLMFVPAFTFLYFSWTSSLIENHSHLTILHSNWGLSSPPGPYFPIFLVWFEFLMICSLALLTYVYASSAKLKRRQALWLIIATFVPLSVGTVTDGIMPILGRDVLPVGVPLTTVTALIIAYAISKYDLFEVNTQNIVASLGEGVLSIDTKGRIMYINEFAEKLLGYKRREIVGEKVLDVVTLIDEKGRNIPAEERPTYLAIHKGVTKTYRNYQLSTKRKRRFWVGFTVSPMIINSSVVGASLNFRDISAEKKIEKNRDEFISIASHELKTPVTVLKLSAQMLDKQMKNQDPNSSSTVNRINSQTDRLVSLVGDLLNVSRLQTGKFVYNNERINVQKLINYSLRQVKPSIDKRKIIKDNELDAMVEVDREKISQVIGNLLVNADKYSPEDKEIKVTTKKVGNTIQIAVSDKGPGVPKGMRRKIFTEYYQANSAGRESQGLGIGLYVSSQIIKDHGGRLWVEQNGKKGATFIFSLPIIHS